MSSNGHGPSPVPAETASRGTAPDSKAPAAEIVPSQHWHDAVKGYVDRARETHADLSVLLIDIDALKAANDELGHAEGHRLIDMVNRVNNAVVQSIRGHNNRKYPDRELDQVTATNQHLKPLGKAVPGVKSPEAQTARIGGDEFGIILPRTDWAGATLVADRVRENVSAELAKPENRELADIGVGVSIGMGIWKPGMETSDFLRSADQAMYVNKLKQLRELSPEEAAKFMEAAQLLGEAGVRPRDVPKYLQRLGASAITNAIENRINTGQLALAETMDSNQES